MTRSDKWKKRPATDKYWQFKDKVREANIELYNGCTITFHISMPVSWSNKKRDSMRFQYHEQKVDNGIMTDPINIHSQENSTHYTDSHERREQTYEAERRWYESGVCYVFENVEVNYVD